MKAEVISDRSSVISHQSRALRLPASQPRRVSVSPCQEKIPAMTRESVIRNAGCRRNGRGNTVG